MKIKKNYVLILLLILSTSAHGQMMQLDTNLYETTTSAKVSTWLKQLKLTPGSGHISILSGLGIQLMQMNVREYIDSFGVSAYYSNTSMITKDLKMAGMNLRKCFLNARRGGVNFVRGSATMAWGALEPSEGDYHFEYIDTTVKIAGLCGINVLGTIIPYADWSMTCTPVDTGCSIFTGGGDFFFLNEGRSGPMCDSDTTAYYNFVEKIVERYDGDGIDDMPGLTLPVLVWEFGNEVESFCGNYDPDNYLRDLDITRRAINEACSNCQLTNGGALEISDMVTDTAFWQKVITDGHQNIDFGNIHFNIGKFTYPFPYTTFKENVDRFQNALTSVGEKTDTWVTEWGIYSGSQNNQPYISEEEQASIYTKLYCWSIANHLTNYFYDLQGTSDNGIGSSALLENISGSDSVKARLFFYTQKLYESKFRDADSALIFLFDTNSFNSGGIKIYKKTATYYVIWGVSNLPSDISGVKVVTDIYGNADTVDVSTLTLPLSSNPIIIEDKEESSITENNANKIHVSLCPNPMHLSATLKIDQNNFNNNEEQEFVLYDLLGKEVLKRKLEKQETLINRENLQNGMYIYQIKNNDAIIASGKISVD